MNSVDAAWVAGIIEGEGSICIIGNKVRVTVCMTDEDVIRALQCKTGKGSLYGPYKKSNFSNKDFWAWAVDVRQDAKELIYEILPFLYSRRTLQALKALDLIDELDAKAKYRKEVCRKGHDRLEAGKNTRGDCLRCVTIWNENRKSKKASV